jgi:hypothetical protein
MKSGIKNNVVKCLRIAKSLRPGKSMLLGAMLSGVSMAAMAAGSITDLTGLTDIICTISNLISGPYMTHLRLMTTVRGG